MEFVGPPRKIIDFVGHGGAVLYLEGELKI